MQDDVNYHYNGFSGHKYVKWGLAFFLFGLLFGFGVLIHYLTGSNYDNTPDFLRNMTLWFGSPLTLSVSYLQIGGLALAILGLAKCFMSKYWLDGTNGTTRNAHKADINIHHGHGHGSLTLCNIGLILLFITGFIGYFIIDAIWPGFYYTPIVAGKNLWLVLQGISLLLFFIGYISAFFCLCKCCKTRCKV